MSEIEERIGYEFKNKSLLSVALTHSSYANEHHDTEDNERLEFLGDSVLGFVTAEYLFNNLGASREGELTKGKAAEVCEKALANFAKRINLGDYIRLSNGEQKCGGAKRDSILSDAFEAVIAAIYLDGGIGCAREFILRFVSVDDLKKTETVRDYKSMLQEIVQHNPGERLEYVPVAEYGPDHDKRFEVDVYLSGNKIGTGIASSKKKAEQLAAKEGLGLLGIEA